MLKLANCRSQFLLDRLGRCLKLFVSSESTFSHKFASQFGLAIFYTREKHKTSGNRTALTCVYLNGATTAIVASGTGRHGWVPLHSSNLKGSAVYVRVCACARTCVRACVMCFQYDNNI